MKIPETTRKVVLATGADGRYAWRLTQAPTPSPRDDQVLVRIHAVALQRADVDLLVNLNSEKGKPHDRDGLVVCSDGAGEVVAVGNNVSSVAVGDRGGGLLRRTP